MPLKRGGKPEGIAAPDAGLMAGVSVITDEALCFESALNWVPDDYLDRRQPLVESSRRVPIPMFVRNVSSWLTTTSAPS
ncbi:hypothetical protein BWO90_06080 (plasmid) [Sinorhizobium meliloti]|nr:hypothetical protein BWO76_00150 [Sinorhizobium meliloti]ATB01629.1 hypothetical protein BWO90_06080 [Sinorhizobium meliloti]